MNNMLLLRSYIIHLVWCDYKYLTPAGVKSQSTVIPLLPEALV